MPCMKPVLLVNANAMKPLVAPIALEYLGAALESEGIPCHVMDLALSEDIEQEVRQTSSQVDPCLVAFTVRNTDDCYYATQHFLLDEVQDTLRLLRRHFEAPVVLGGAGFSVMPEFCMATLGVDLGVWGEGETALPLLAKALDPADRPNIPGLVWRKGDRFIRNPASISDLSRASLSRRAWVNNLAYQQRGGMAGLETSRGCSGTCVYCADPLSKGTQERFRDPRDVGQEARSLVSQGITHVHLCDSECNRSVDHLRRVCEEWRPLKWSWYAYARPCPFDAALAEAMVSAGCVGLNFGVDAGHDGMLKALGRDFTVQDIRSALRSAKKAGMRVMVDLLLGGPGETEDSVWTTVEEAKGWPVDCVGLSIGLRIYPGTRLAQQVASSLGKGETFLPHFYVSKDLPADALGYVRDLVGKDERFFLPAGDEDSNYNYDGNEVLVQAIQRGERGAFWDILTRLRSEDASQGRG